MEAFFITLIMLILPIGIAIADNRRRRKKGVPSVRAFPIDRQEEMRTEILPPDELSEDWTEGEDVITPAEAPLTRPETAMPASRTRARTAKPAPEEADGGDKGERFSEKRKLIIYSEILKPKFDE